MNTRVRLLLVFIFAGWSASFTFAQVIDVGTSKAVAFENGISPDKHYAAGWTILRRNKEAPPVDWSKWNADDALNFITTYADPQTEITDQDDYQLVDCLIDLKAKTLVILPSTDPYFPHKNHGFFEASWSSPTQTPRYAFLKNDARYSNTNLWLVSMSANKMTQTDLADQLQKVIAPILQEKRPLNFDSYGINYSLTDDKIKTPFEASAATITFDCDIARAAEQTTVSGQLKIHLPDGKIIKATSDTPTDDPFTELPALGKADQELNQVYAKLQQKLTPTQRADLKKEQLDWINLRNSNASQAEQTATDNNVTDTTVARNKSMLEDTQARLAALKARLK